MQLWVKGFALIGLLGLAACVQPQGGSAARPPVQSASAEPAPNADQAAHNFVSVARRMEPAIEAECRARTRGQNRSCDFQIMVDDRQGQEPNAFQTLDKQGRPVVAFNLALIATAQNTDELAFVMGHEAAHHIAAHLPRTENSALAGALILGTLAAAYGADAGVVQDASDIGASVGARAYSQDFELEADRLGTVLAWNAGYNPERGAQFFNRLGDPGDQFLGTHPGNSRRVAIVSQTVADLRAGRLR